MNGLTLWLIFGAMFMGLFLLFLCGFDVITRVEEKEFKRIMREVGDGPTLSTGFFVALLMAIFFSTPYWILIDLYIQAK